MKTEGKVEKLDEKTKVGEVSYTLTIEGEWMMGDERTAKVQVKIRDMDRAMAREVARSLGFGDLKEAARKGLPATVALSTPQRRLDE
ncbi:MAG: hypothetical protein PHZ19_05000 [Candidatus Thermoplasmatota archaeon]|nr:hypothetical protein [Candidatus Thermoplasmatota archaeon]